MQTAETVAAAAGIHYTDDRVHQLVRARHALLYPGGRPALHEVREGLVQDARDWLRAAVAAGLLPASPEQ